MPSNELQAARPVVHVKAFSAEPLGSRAQPQNTCPSFSARLQHPNLLWLLALLPALPAQPVRPTWLARVDDPQGIAPLDGQPHKVGGIVQEGCRIATTHHLQRADVLRRWRLKGQLVAAEVRVCGALKAQADSGCWLARAARADHRLAGSKKLKRHPRTALLSSCGACTARNMQAAWHHRVGQTCDQPTGRPTGQVCRCAHLLHCRNREPC